jgi:hypothetical protein
MRKLMRVPLDFDYPLHKVWYGYLMNHVQNTCMLNNENKRAYCERCRLFAKMKDMEFTDYGCPHYDFYFAEMNDKLQELCEPPKGVGYQLWETMSKGSPISPVFRTLDELCEWCETNATTFANFKATKEQWKQMLSEDESDEINKDSNSPETSSDLINVYNELLDMSNSYHNLAIQFYDEYDDKIQGDLMAARARSFDFAIKLLMDNCFRK